jgi:hypothetical protein
MNGRFLSCWAAPARGWFSRLSWRAAGRGRGMGHVRVACISCRDEFGQTVFFEPPHHSGHQPLAGWVAGPGPSPPGER